MLHSNSTSLGKMYPEELATMNSMSFEFPTQFPSDFILLQNTSPTPNFDGLFNNLPTSPTFYNLHEFNLQHSGVSCNSTSDEAEDLQSKVIDERKRRRMISNRESARRSRMRKQRHIDELWSQVMKMRTENQNLMSKLKKAAECHDKVLQENTQLKQDAADLREMITSLQLDGSFGVLKELDESPSNQFSTESCSCKLKI